MSDLPMPSPTLSKAGVEAARFAYEEPQMWTEAPTTRLTHAITAYLAAAQTTEAPVAVEWRHETRLRKWADWLKEQAIAGAGFGTVTRLCDDLNEIATEMDRLRAAPSYAGEGVVVRELEWARVTGTGYITAKTPFGEYTVTHYEDSDPAGGGWEVVRDDADVIGSYPSEADGIAAAQSHFDAAIRSALAPAIASPRGADGMAMGKRNRVLDLAKRAASAELSGDQEAFNQAIRSLDDLIYADRALASPPSDGGAV